MRVQCTKCQKFFNDANRSTRCPHRELKSAQQRRSHKLAMTMLGKLVVFKHLPNMEPRNVMAVEFTGMIGVNGLTGWYAPEMFEVVGGERQ